MDEIRRLLKNFFVDLFLLFISSISNSSSSSSMGSEKLGTWHLVPSSCGTSPMGTWGLFVHGKLANVVLYLRCRKKSRIQNIGKFLMHKSAPSAHD